MELTCFKVHVLFTPNCNNDTYIHICAYVYLDILSYVHP